MYGTCPRGWSSWRMTVLVLKHHKLSCSCYLNQCYTCCRVCTFFSHFPQSIFIHLLSPCTRRSFTSFTAVLLYLPHIPPPPTSTQQASHKTATQKTPWPSSAARKQLVPKTECLRQAAVASPRPPPAPTSSTMVSTNGSQRAAVSWRAAPPPGPGCLGRWTSRS